MSTVLRRAFVGLAIRPPSPKFLQYLPTITAIPKAQLYFPVCGEYLSNKESLLARTQAQAQPAAARGPFFQGQKKLKILFCTKTNISQKYLKFRSISFSSLSFDTYWGTVGQKFGFCIDEYRVSNLKWTALSTLK